MPDRKLPDDRELEDFLAGRSELSQRYRQDNPREGAPSELDSLVLDRARHALQPRARRARFIVPLALAASLVLTFSVVLKLREETAGSLPPPPSAEKKEIAPQGKPQPVTQPAAPAEAAAGSAAAQMAPPAARAKSLEADDAKLRPQAWLDRIRKLKTDGRIDDAQRELDAFRSAYPDEPVPEDLQSLPRP